MDGTTEPVVAVLGHPIAGNPSQFALERAFESMRLDWRVLSFDISPDALPLALSGLEVLDFQGVLIDRDLRSGAATWFFSKTRTPPIPASSSHAWFDCLCRDSEDPAHLSPFDAEKHWLSARIEQHFQKFDGSSQPGSMIDFVGVVGKLDQNAQSLLPERYLQSMQAGFVDFAAATSVPSFVDNRLILVGSEEPSAIPIEMDEWAALDQSALVVDLSAGYPLLDKIEQSGFDIVDTTQLHAGALCYAMQKWTSRKPSLELIRDAIEEYQAV